MIETLFEFLRKPLTLLDIKLNSELITKVRIVIVEISGFCTSLSWDFMLDINYDPLMMSQKEAPRKHPGVFPRKVAYLV